MNILYFSPSNSIGGAELSLVSILKEANKHGYNAYVGLPPPKRGDLTYMNILKPVCKAIHIVRPMIWHIPYGLNWRERFVSYLYHIFLSGWHIVPVFKLLKIIRKHNIDIIHTNTLMAIDAAIASKLAGIPHIWHIREGIGHYPIANIKLPFQKYPKPFKWIIDPLSSKIITNSKFTASLAMKYFTEPKIEVIYNSLPNEWFVPKKYEAEKKKFIIGIVANVTAKWKNHLLAIEVANLVRHKNSNLDITFYIYGNLPDDDDPYYLELLNRVKSLGLTDIVFFKGRLHVHEIYNAIDLLFHPSNMESFGRIFIEAMGKGIPIIAVKGGGADELIEDGKTGFKFDSKNYEDIANKIIELIENPDMYDHIADNGFKYASSQFKSSLMWEKIVKIYYNETR